MASKKTVITPATAELLDLDFASEIPINILCVVPNQGEIRLSHVFKMPTAEDRLHYYDRLAQLQAMQRTQMLAKADDKKKAEVPEISQMRAAVELYDLLALRTEGYNFPRGKDFKAALPPEHKSWAIGLLLNVTGIITGTELKNSSGGSAKRSGAGTPPKASVPE